MIAIAEVLPGCGSKPEDSATRVAQQPVSNGTVDSNGSYNSVVQVDIGKSGCSGTQVTPYYVLTANHCVTGTLRDGLDCAWAGAPKIADLTVPATVRFFLAGNGFYPGQASLVVQHTLQGSGQALVPRVAHEVDLCVQSEAALDIALVRLDQRVPTTQFAPVNPPILGNPGLTWSPSCTQGLDSSDFTATVVGYGRDELDLTPLVDGDWDLGSSGNDARQRQQATSSDWFRESGVVRNEWSVWSTYEGLLPGDSGGALFSNKGRLCGVNSRYSITFNPDPRMFAEVADIESAANQKFLQDNILDVTRTHFVGQCNADDPRPWSDATLDETLKGDADSMPDGCDPCPFATEKDPRGDFTRGEDDDYDGVPDRCDNCPPSYCTQQGLNTKYCFNPYPEKFGAQADRDQDGIGDICDSCPMDPAEPLTGASADDPDNDHVGAACDNCSKRNAYAACKSDDECTYATADGKVKKGFCIARNSFGICNDDTGWACLKDIGNQDCREGAICGGTDYGRCSQQLDDINDNGVGGVCDSCDKSPGETILANSNWWREKVELAPPRGDACDPVPLFSSRAVKEWNSAYDYTKRVRFITSAGSGRDELKGYQTTSVALTAGLRWSNCRFQEGSDPSKWNVPLEKCLEQRCTVNPKTGYNPKPGEATTWKRVSTAAYPFGASSFPGAGLDQTYPRTFSTVVGFDPFWHGKGENEQLRIGALENLFWDHATDTASGAVSSYLEQGVIRTTGAFWGHVEDDKIAYASQRDDDYFHTKGVSGGGLRDHYTYLITPIKPPVLVDQFVPFTKCQILGNCNPYFRGDIIEFHLAAQPPGGFSELPPLGGLMFCPKGDCKGFTAIGAVPLGALVPPALATAFADPGRIFLSPVESPQRAFAEPHSATPMAVGLSRSWEPGSRIDAVAFNGEKLTFDCRACDLGLAAAKAESESGPGARALPTYTYSARHRAVYMVGGNAPGGAPTREIWRHDLGSSQWTRVLAPEGNALSDPAPHDVRAVGFDPGRRQLAFIDFTQKVIGKGLKLPVARLVVLDVAKRVGTVALVLPRIGIYERVDLVARGDGTWVLVGQVKSGTVWQAFQLEISAGGTLTWTGHRSGLGALADAPFNTAGGVLLPVLRKGKLELERLDPAAFQPGAAGCSHL